MTKNELLYCKIIPVRGSVRAAALRSPPEPRPTERPSRRCSEGDHARVASFAENDVRPPLGRPRTGGTPWVLVPRRDVNEPSFAVRGGRGLCFRQSTTLPVFPSILFKRSVHVFHQHLTFRLEGTPLMKSLHLSVVLPTSC